MMGFNWKTFADRVPAGTHVKGVGFVIFGSFPSNGKAFCIAHQEGVIVRHGHELENAAWFAFNFETQKSQIIENWLDTVVVDFFNDTESRDISPENLQYLINDQWLTFEEVMA